jgi:CubicO group peptidase (beta-lactamase class C family)
VAPIDAKHLESQLTPYLQSYGRNWGETNAFSGYVHIAQGDVVLYSKGFGYRDRERKLKNSADTSFRIGSTTKQFTAAAILRLEEQGKLSVHDAIGKYIPEYPKVGANITIHQLLGHTSGIPNYTEFPDLMENREKAHSRAQMLQAFWEKPLGFEPGSKFSYSNSGYFVLGVIIEGVSGMSYADFVRTQLFEAAGLTHTTVGDAANAADRALGYHAEDGAVLLAPPIDMSVPFSAGAVRSTANDLARWHLALQGSSILSDESKAKLYKPGLENYAYGWFVEEENGHKDIQHGGGIDGFLTAYHRIMDANLVVIVLSNNTGVAPEPIANAAIKAAFGGTLEPVVEGKKVALDLDKAQACSGEFHLTDESRAWLTGKVPNEVVAEIETMSIRVDGGSLKMKPAGQPEFTLQATDSGGYLNSDLKLELNCKSAGDEGAVDGIEVVQGGASLHFTRAEAPAGAGKPL